MTLRENPHPLAALGAKRKTYPIWNAGCLLSGQKEKPMRNVLVFKTAACAEYERLLRECQQALLLLHERRQQVRQDHLTGVEVGRELLTLQARYAKAYGALLKHSKHCDRCQFDPKFAKSQSVGTV
jgi:hypothetical protein